MSEPSTPPPPAGPAAAAPPPAALAHATSLFERGDFLGARQEVARLLAAKESGPGGSGGPEIEAAARALLDRMGPDRWTARFGVLVLVLLALVTGLYVR